jgi:hypothetical protein
MDKNKFWLVGRIFNTASPRLGAPLQHVRKARPQVGRPNALPQGKRKAHLHVRKLGAAMQRKARPQDGQPKRKTHPQ